MLTLDIRRLTYAAAALSMILAGLVHGLVTPKHFDKWWGYGLFFFVAAFAQVAYGVLLLLRPWAHDETGGERSDPETDRRTVAYYVMGIAGNLAIIALWVVTRTVGIPFFGPDAGEVEEVTLISLVSKAIEAALIVCLIVLIRRTQALAHTHSTGAMA